MSAYYDSYDYSAYWNGRDYEHEAEVLAIRRFLSKIKKVNKAIEIGGGFGRIVPFYIYRTKKTVLTEPSNKLLATARKNLAHFKNLQITQSAIETLTKKFKKHSFDLILMIRVMHHMDDLDKTFTIFDDLLAENGYLILEFANKIHFKNSVGHIVKRDFAFLKDKSPIDIRSEKAKRQKMITFLNHHPSAIQEKLQEHNFEIVDILSVSNIRSPLLKTYLPKAALLELERALQKPLSYIYFGPSIFLLAKKRGN